MSLEHITLALFAARMVETLNALKLGVVLADQDCRILHANRAAQEMMRDGSPLLDRAGVLRAERGAASLGAAIRHAARHERGIDKAGLAVRLTEEEGPIVAHVLPLAVGEMRAWPQPAAVAAVFVNPVTDDAASAQTVAAIFALTPAETRVLARVLSGSSMVEAAAGLGVAATTVRSHPDSIFAKTGVSRQSQLLRLAARIASVVR